jgi:TonB family protein
MVPAMFLIVYKGLGLWIPIILIGCLFVVFIGAIALVAGPTQMFNDRQVLESGDAYLLASVSLFMAGAICFFWGQRVNRPAPIDPFAKTLVPSPDHSLYFVKMQYWGVLFLALGVYFFWQVPAGDHRLHPHHAPYAAGIADTPAAATPPTAMPPAATLSTTSEPSLHALVPVPADDSPSRLRIPADQQAQRILKQIPPTYPGLAEDAGIQGKVTFSAIIGKDGRVKDLTLVSGHPLLAPAAEHAARQWVYKPTLMDGEPREVETRIDVVFSLKRR